MIKLCTLVVIHNAQSIIEWYGYRLTPNLLDVMELFVYNWFYTGYSVYGHCLNNARKYVLIKVLDFQPSCFVEGETVPESTVVPCRAEYRRMLSSRDVSRTKPFYRLFFTNGKELESYARECKVRCDMADIPQVTAFLSGLGIDHVGWVRVPSSSVKQSDIEPLHNRIPLSSPRTLAFDIEVKSSDSGMPQPHRIADTVEMISVVVFGGGATTDKYIMHTLKEPLGIEGVIDVIFSDEMSLVSGFFELVGKEDPTVLTGFNIYGFDLHYMVSRLRLRLLEIPDVSRGVPESINLIKVDWTSDAYGHNSYDRLVIGGRLIVDLYLYFRRMKLDKYSLDFVSRQFLGEGKNNMPYEKMSAAFDSGDIIVLKEVAQYCVQDSVLVMKLFDKVQMWIDACEIAKITRCGIEEIYTRGEQMKMVSQCVAECAKRNIVLQPQFQSEWKEYSGAYVLDPVRGVYDGCSILDFQSLYPSIIIAYNICPSTYVKSSFVDVHCVGEHRFRKKPVGLLPGMIERILDERKTVKKIMSSAELSSVEYVVLDRRQNALKICANSVYGMMGFKNSRYFGHIGCAESVTTVGRLLLEDIVKKIESSYSVKVVYGDSVAGYTPTTIRVGKEKVKIETVENIGHNWVKYDDKEACELSDVEVWTERGWTPCQRVIRHALAPNKKMMRVITDNGIVDVTKEHSLLDAYGTPLHAEHVQVGDTLLHHKFEPICNDVCVKKAKILGFLCGIDPESMVYLEGTVAVHYIRTVYRDGETVVPDEILNSSLESRSAFWDGLCGSNWKTLRRMHQVSIASFAALASGLGYNISLQSGNGFYQLVVTYEKHNVESTAVKKVHEIEYSGYVYDLTTENHHFQAGPGSLIVHNTDSCMLWHRTDVSADDNIQLAQSICGDITATLPRPMALKFETYCEKVILLTKKRYILVSRGSSGAPNVSYKGVINARRDYCKYAKDTYADTIQMVAMGERNEDIAEYIDKRILKLMSGKADVLDLIVTKSMAKKLNAYKVNQPHVVLARRLVQKTGIDIPAGTRLEFLHVKGSCPLVTPEEFSEGDWSANGRFYVEKQLATQVDDVLSAIGMGNYISDTWLTRFSK